MRRAMRNGRLTGFNDAYLYKLTGFVADLMKPAYPELQESISRVSRIVRDEETRYATTFQIAERFFHDEAKSAVNGVLPGAAAFKLYDTFGLALEEQEDMAREFGLQIDQESFNAEMEKQNVLSRAPVGKVPTKPTSPMCINRFAPVEFIGRETLESPVEVVNSSWTKRLPPSRTR